jgi:hypothetical protein
MKKTGLNYSEAIEAIKAGKMVKLPEWTGHWYADKVSGNILVLTKTGDVLDTPNHSHVIMREDFEITDGKKGFDFAVLALKNGKMVSRAGWNGKGMFIFMRPADKLTTDFIINKVKSLPDSVKQFYAEQDSKEHGSEQGLTQVQFTAYICMKAADGTIVNGWLASQTDMLAEDWELV